MAGYLGVDVGSISTNVVVIDAGMQVLAREYLMTVGRPLEAITEGLEEGGGKQLQGRGTDHGRGHHRLGALSHRGLYSGADVVRNEITWQATAAAAINPRVDTILEIGGQGTPVSSA